MVWYLSSWIAGTTIRLTRTYAPTNIIAGFIRTRRGHKWGIPIAVVLIPSYAFAFIRVAETEIPTRFSWLYLFALLMYWNTGKILSLAIVSVALLVRAKVREGSRECPAGGPTGTRRRWEAA